MADRDQVIDELVLRYRKLLEQRLPRTPQKIDQIEETVEEISREMERELEQQILDQQQTPPDNRACCPHCGSSARYRGLQERVLLTRHGERRLRRRYYHCGACSCGFAPLDLALGLDHTALSPLLRSHLARLGAWQPFAEAVATLSLLTGVQVSAKSAERAAVSVGEALSQALQATAHRHHQGQLPDPRCHPKRLYVQMDGVMTPLRNPWKWDGSLGELTCRWGECKIGAVYEARADTQGELSACQVAYTTTLHGIDVFAPRIATLAHQRGVHFAREVIVLGDGAAWIWRLSAAQFPRAIEIVDFYHASQHLWAVAEARFGASTPEAATWVRQRKEELFADRMEAVLTAIDAWEARNREATALQAREHEYFERNAERMRYGSFRQKGYQIASGVIESACKHVVASRVDQAGMHWRQETAEAIVCLRAAIRSQPTVDLRPYCSLAA